MSELDLVRGGLQVALSNDLNRDAHTLTWLETKASAGQVLDPLSTDHVARNHAVDATPGHFNCENVATLRVKEFAVRPHGIRLLDDSLYRARRTWRCRTTASGA